MVATKKYINSLRSRGWMHIDRTLERYILSEYEEEPFPYEWSEQDLYEQIRNLVNEYNAGNLVVPLIPYKLKRLQNRYHELQKDFLDLVQQYYERCGGLPQQFGYLSMSISGYVDTEEEEYEF